MICCTHVFMQYSVAVIDCRFSVFIHRKNKNILLSLCDSDVQIVNEVMLEDINNILNAGDVPNLYAPEDLDAIMTACR